MSQLLELKIGGLWTNPNGLSEVPPGTMSIANNVVVDRESIVESRRGFKQYGGGIGSYDIKSIFTFNDQVIVLNENNELYYDSDNAGTWVKYLGSYPSPDIETKTRSFQSNKNFYFTTNNGLQKLTSIAAVPRAAGAPKALSGTATPTGTSGWFETGTNVAYRIAWGYRDANQNLIIGPPSDRIETSNTSGATRNTQITFQTPIGIDETWFYQVYRSPLSSDVNTVASDEMQQVFENNPTAGEVSSRSITFTDIVPESMKQAALYTNSTQEGISNANWAPPFAKDICIFKSHAFYANTRTLQRKYFNLISVGGTDGIQIGDTLTFTDNAGESFTLTGAAAENSAVGIFKVETSLTPAENVDATARSIVSVINKYNTNTFLNAYYTSGYDELPGQMLFEKRTLNELTFYANSNRSSCWTPRILATGQDVASSNDSLPNRIFISKQQQPEAVPLLNYIDVGASNQPIERVLTLRDGIIVLKGDGIFRISGDTISNFRVSLIDSTVRILAKESAVVLSNQCFFYSDQGVVAASDVGAKVISRPIENLLTPFVSSTSFPNFARETFGISYESDRKYILFTPVSGTDTYARKAYVYNIFTNSWTNWIIDVNCGIVNSLNNRLYFGCPYKSATNPSHIKIERKDFASTDFADEEYAFTISSIAGFTFNVSSTANIREGDLINQKGNKANVISIDSPTQMTVDNVTDFVADVATAYRPIKVSFTFDNISGDNPGIMKHFRRISYFFNDAIFDSIDSRIQSDLSNEIGNITMTRTRKNQWGSGKWGKIPWGGGINSVQRVDSIIPQGNQRANWLNISIDSEAAFSSVSLNGISLQFHAMGERFK